jgi:hypothetical protein
MVAMTVVSSRSCRRSRRRAKPKSRAKSTGRVQTRTATGTLPASNSPTQDDSASLQNRTGAPPLPGAAEGRGVTPRDDPHSSPSRGEEPGKASSEGNPITSKDAEESSSHDKTHEQSQTRSGKAPRADERANSPTGGTSGHTPGSPKATESSPPVDAQSKQGDTTSSEDESSRQKDSSEASEDREEEEDDSSASKVHIPVATEDPSIASAGSKVEESSRTALTKDLSTPITVIFKLDDRYYSLFHDLSIQDERVEALFPPGEWPEQSVVFTKKDIVDERQGGPIARKLAEAYSRVLNPFEHVLAIYHESSLDFFDPHRRQIYNDFLGLTLNIGLCRYFRTKEDGEYVISSASEIIHELKTVIESGEEVEYQVSVSKRFMNNILNGFNRDVLESVASPQSPSASQGGPSSASRSALNQATGSPASRESVASNAGPSLHDRASGSSGTTRRNLTYCTSAATLRAILCTVQHLLCRHSSGHTMYSP